MFYEAKSDPTFHCGRARVGADDDDELKRLGYLRLRLRVNTPRQCPQGAAH